MKKQGTIDIEQIIEACQLGKQHRMPFRNIAPRSTNLGELIHSDVGGRVQEESIDGSRFYVIFKDDSTGYTQIYFMKHKSDVFEKFKEFNALIVN